MTAASNVRGWLDLERPVVRHGLAFGVGLLALLLRCWQLDVQPLWLDEAMTAHIAHAPDGLDFVHNTPPLYYWLLRLWTGCFGIGATGLRSLSALAGAGFVWASFHTARVAFGNRAALPTSLLALLSPIHLYYSQEARAYSLLLFVLMVALWMLWRLVQRVTVGSLVTLVVASTAALYTHYLAAMPLLLAYAAISLSAPAAVRPVVVKAVAVAGAVAVAFTVLWVWWWSRRTPFEPLDMRWLSLLWSQLSAGGAFAASFELLLLGGQEGRTPIFLKQFTTLAFPDAARMAAVVAIGGLVAGLLLRLRQAPASRRWVTIQCLVLVLGPLIGLWSMSFLSPVYCPGRYDLIALPGLLLLLGGAIGSVIDTRSTMAKWLAGTCVSVFAVVVVAKDVCYFAADAGVDPTGPVASHLEANVQADETVVFCGMVGLPVLVHLYQRGFSWSDRVCRSPRTNAEFGCRLLPSTLETAPATVSRYLRAVEDGSLATGLATMLSSPVAPGVWFVLGEDLRTGGRDPAAEATARRLFDVLHEAGYQIVGGEPRLGIAHLRRRSGR